MVKASPFNTRKLILAALERVLEPIDAVEISGLCGATLQSTKGALSAALTANVVHVAKTERCRGGKRRFYLIGAAPVPETVQFDPFATLRAMQADAAANGCGLTTDGKLRLWKEWRK